MARKFLYFVAIMIVLVIAGLIVLRIWSKELTAIAFVPTTDFAEQTPLEANAYQDPELWYSRPGIGLDDPARWQPAYRDEGRSLPQPADPKPGNFAVFFIHPTSFLDRSNWNAPIGSTEAEDRARLYLRGLASPFNQASEIWAPKYRQATMGAFLTDKPEGQKALDAAYADVKQAFAFFLTAVDEDTPIVLAGHSQGSLHLLRLLLEEVNGSATAPRIVAAYVVGWPVSVEHDLPALGLPACAAANQTGCLLSWSTFAEPADPTDVLDTYSSSKGFDGELRGNSQILCTNPLTGRVGGEAEAAVNLGTLVPDGDLANGDLVRGSVPARCDDRGLLLIGDPPEMGSYVLPGNNYHVYDIPLFWANVQQDVATRVSAWQQARPNQAKPSPAP
ncbi:DUF3089 domain-containing protein [Altererythrobacter arenosus]|uniref:DUF3089 domain-containing protein n=1 Tax=Altererythrobacter arenosus TaxID=3032592 RepID=A0ABY8FU35_9SPHN|nr:DUF3089 domain-containing protein [Altererythrobacter sp. CAU 1644]WFL77600.1 DUF3089 domain-containing protein [Altererythrobacter sp. CAU 1644]